MEIVDKKLIYVHLKDIWSALYLNPIRNDWFEQINDETIRSEIFIKRQKRVMQSPNSLVSDWPRQKKFIYRWYRYT